MPVGYRGLDEGAPTCERFPAAAVRYTIDRPASNELRRSEWKRSKGATGLSRNGVLEPVAAVTSGVARCWGGQVREDAGEEVVDDHVNRQGAEGVILPPAEVYGRVALSLAGVPPASIY